ncbi:MAG: UDP-N-acetylmuramate dehydrogenase [Bacteroidia bacterium]
MQKFSNASLKAYNTFGLDVKAQKLYIVEQESDLHALEDLGVFEEKHMVLGGGSNVLLTQDFDGAVVLIATKGKEVIDTLSKHVIVKFAAGEIWHNCVIWAIKNDFGGIENLSLIPGTTGAAPMQNIGAYGVEIKDTFSRLKAFNKSTGGYEYFDAKACNFGYRESVFKHKLKDKYIITSVEFKLTKFSHKTNTSYGAISGVLENKGIENPSIKDVSEAVIEIRQSKLPDPKEIGNSGSFFKNPIVDSALAKSIKANHPKMPAYPAGEGKTKLAAGWLIEQCGWKGKRIGETGSHAKQALVLVNYGNANGNEIWSLALDIQSSVKKKFGIDIHPEVNVV